MEVIELMTCGQPFGWRGLVLLVALSLLLGQAVQYLQDMRDGKIRPHPFTWLIWSSLNVTVLKAQLVECAGFAVLFPVSGMLICAYIAWRSFALVGRRYHPAEMVALLIALTSVGMIMLGMAPWLAVATAVFANTIAAGLTIVKVLLRQGEETSGPFVIGSISLALSIVALENFAPANWLYMASSIANNLVLLWAIHRSREPVAA